MSTKPITPRGKAVTNWNLDGSPIGDDWHMQAFQRAGSVAPVAATSGDTAAAPHPVDVAAITEAAFAAGNIVVYRVGDGSAALSGAATAVFLDEYTASGSFVRSIALPTTDSGANQTLTAAGTATSEGYLTLSTDGHYLVFGGYDAAVGTATPNTVASSTIARVIGRVDSDGVVDTTTALVTNGFSAQNIRSVASTDGQTFWAVGSGTGVITATHGGTSGTIVSSTATNLRSVGIFDGQLYIGSGAGTIRMGAVGTGLPTTGPQTITTIPGFPTATNQSNQFYFADLTASVSGVDTLYIADDRASGSGGGLLKYSLVSGSWTLNGTVAGSLRGLTAATSGTTVTFFATDTTASANHIVTLIDTGGYNAAFSSSTLTTIATAGTNTVFRGIAFAPTPAVVASPGALAINDVSHSEGDSGSTTYTFTVTRAGGSTGAVSAAWTLNAAGGAGNADASDFVIGQATSGTVNFADGQTSQTITINVQGDNQIETDENFTVVLSAPTGGATLSDASGTGTIVNDDFAGSLAINDVTLAEGNSGTTAFTFTVTRSGGSDGAVSADYTVNLPGGVGGADATDFQVGQVLSGTVSFADGETSKTITLQVQGDLVEEPNETFTVTLSNPQGGATISDGSGLGTITNDDSPPVGSINDVSVAEGTDGVTYMTFTVTLDHSSTNTVTFNYATADGTATAGSDYVARSGQISFAPGETSHTISIPIIGDANAEANETLTVALSNPVNGSIGDGSGLGTITNDDGSTYYSLAGGSFTQNWTNTGLITTNDVWSGVPYIIGFRGDDLTTATGTDARTITTTSNVIDVNANQTNPNTNTSGGVTEFDGIANPVVALQGSGTADAPYLALYMDASGRSNIRVQANLRDIDGSTDDAAQQIAVQYRTSANGAWVNAPGGYFSDVTTGGSATQVTAVDITLPADANGAATLEIRFLTTNAAGNDEWVGIDDIVVSSQQSGPILSIGNTAVLEGDAGTTPITFTVTRAGDPAGAVTADYTVTFPGGVNGATSDDFAAGQLFSGQVHFADGQTSATITLNVAGDVAPELDDNFTVTLSNAVGGTIGDGVATGTIVNDDGQPPLVSINDVTVSEGDSGTHLMTFTVTRTGGTGAFDVNYETQDGTATAGSDYDPTSGSIHFADGQTTATIDVVIHGDTDSEVSETLNMVLSSPTNFALLTDAVGVGTIAGDDPIYIHDIQGTSYFSPLLAAEGIHAFNIASAGLVTVRAIVTAVDDDGPRQGYYLSEEVTDWDGNSFTSEGIFVMTRNDSSVGTVVSGVAVGDLVQVSANVMEYQAFNNMPRTMLVNPTGLSVISHGNPLPVLTLTNIPNEVLTSVTPDYFDSHDDPNDTFDASTYALSYFETVEGMLVTVPHMVVADGFVQGGQASPFFQAYSLDSANADQINSRGGYTIAGDPPVGPPDTPGTGDDTHNGGLVLHDGDVNPDVIQVEFGGFGMDAPAGLHDNASMGDQLGDLTGIIDFDFTDRVLYVTDMNPGSFVDTQVTRETTSFGGDTRALTMAAFNVNNLDPGDGAARFTAIADAIAHNLNAPDIVSIEEIQDNNGATNDGTTDASTTWQMLVDALNLATGAHYQWVDQAPVNGTEGGEPGGNIRVGFLYNTDRVQLGDLDANATLAERRQFTDRIGDGVRDAGDRIAYDDSMIAGEIATSDWSSTRRSLLGEFNFHGNTVYVTANHFTAKGGSGEFWQFDQDQAGDPLNAGWDKRNNQAQDIYTMLNLIQQSNPNVGIISGGDYNDFYFYRPLTTLTGYTNADGTARVGGARFDNLTITLPEAERYTYTFDGRSQAIDHIVVNDLLAGVATYDVVHLNTGFNPANTLAISDHDPGISTFDFRNFSERLTGTAGADNINGYGGNDIINGGDGDDILDGGTGDDTLAGGMGNDFYFVDSKNDVVLEAPGQGSDRVFASTSYELLAGSSVEILSTDFNTGTAAINLTGNELANILIGNDGDNILIGGAGADALVGRLGNDYFFIDNAGDTVAEGTGEGTDRAFAGASWTLTAGAEVEVVSTDWNISTAAINLTGNALGNTLIGNDGDNILDGKAGADTLAGLLGNDWYFVDNINDRVVDGLGQGTDRVFATASWTLSAGAEIEVLSTDFNAGTAAINLTGNELAQTIFGNNAANVLDGGDGADTLVGLGGADTFLFSTALGAGNVDNVVDFQVGFDQIGLDNNVFTAAGGTGTLNANAFVIGSAAQDASDRIIYDAATGALYYDADGNGAGAAVQFAQLSSHLNLTASDFMVL